MSTIPPLLPPLPIERAWKKNIAPAATFGWLAAGWRDFATNPAASITYGLLVCLISAGTVVGLFAFG